MARQQRLESRKHAGSKVAASLREVRFVFEEASTWQSKTYAEMTAEEQDVASKDWREAEESEAAAQEEPTSASSDAAEHVDIRASMGRFMRAELKWTQKELHDACVLAGVGAPAAPSMAN